MRHAPRRLAILVPLLAWACNPTPDAAADHLRRGDAALAEGRYPEALSAYTHARELAPHDPAVQRALMRARAYAVAENPARLGPDALTDTEYEADLLLETDKPRAAVYLTVLGHLLAKRGDVEGAKVKFTEALKADAASPIAHTALALALSTRKDGIGQAKAELEQALKTKPDYGGALLALGQIELGEGDLEGAAARLQAAVRVTDEFAAHMALGSVRVEQQRPAEAVEQFQRAAQIDPRSPDALGSLGQALLNAGRADDAERALRAAAQIRLDETTEVALGFALARQKKQDQALGVFSQVLAQNGGAATALYGAAAASEGLGKNEDALAYYRRLLALPAEGRQQHVIADLQKDAQGRVAALSAAAASAPAPASASASSAVPHAPPARPPGR
jgi:tetratricopeptide (TPR) repeat protein